MQIPANIPHKFASLVLRELTINALAELQVTGQIAYLNKEGLTCGKLTVTGMVLAPDTLDALRKLMALIERDAASVVFDIGTTPESSSSNSPAEPM